MDKQMVSVPHAEWLQIEHILALAKPLLEGRDCDISMAFDKLEAMRGERKAHWQQEVGSK